MRILFVNKFLYRKGGSETYLFEVADALRSLGHEIGFFSMQDEKNVPCEQSEYFVSNSDYNGKVSLVKQVRQAASLVYSFEARQKFDSLLREFRPDVIHLNLVHRQITFSILDAQWLREHPTPVVYTAHDFVPVCPNCTFLDGSGMVCEACLDGNFRHCVERRCVKHSAAKSAFAAAEAKFLRAHGSYRRIDCYIAPSEFMRSKLIGGGFPANRVLVMRNFLPKAKKVPIAQGVEEKEPYFLYFGRLSPEKGVEVLLDAFSAVSDSLPREWRLKIAGTGPLEGELKRRVSDPGVSCRIDFLGFRTGGALESLVGGASWTVVPSVWYENMPYSIVESLAAGTPVIGSDLGGIPELVHDEETGLLFKPGSNQSLADALLQATSTVGDEYRDLAKGSQELVRSDCSQDKYLSNLVDLYNDLIEAKKES